jgi:hypothetical protein
MDFTTAGAARKAALVRGPYLSRDTNPAGVGVSL